MAIDTKNKRASSLDHGDIWQPAYVVADGTITQADRQISIWVYGGILAAGTAVIKFVPKFLLLGVN